MLHCFLTVCRIGFGECDRALFTCDYRLIPRPDAAKELDTQLAEVELMLSNLDEQDAALDMLKEGRTPQSKGEVPDPVVTTVS